MQRSGTNYLYWNLEKDVRVEGYNEDNPQAFDNFLLKSADNTKKLIDASKAQIVLFKSITNAFRADALLSIDSAAKIIWIVRDCEQVIESHQKEFGDPGIITVTKALQGIKSKYNEFFIDKNHKFPESRLSDLSIQNLVSNYAAQYLSICETEYDKMALYWALLNNMYFIFAFDKSRRVKAVTYDQVIAHPRKVFREISKFCGLSEFEPAIKVVKPKSKNEVKISDGIKLLCTSVKRGIEQSEFIKWNCPTKS